MIYNLDTSIIIDFLEVRKEHSKDLINKIIKEDILIIFSDLHIKELKHLGYNLEEISNFFKIFKVINVRHVHINRIQLDEAEAISYKLGIPKGDVLHAIIAGGNGAIMVTNDRDFDKLRGIVEVRKPKELL